MRIPVVDSTANSAQVSSQTLTPIWPRVSMGRGVGRYQTVSAGQAGLLSVTLTGLSATNSNHRKHSRTMGRPFARRQSCVAMCVHEVALVWVLLSKPGSGLLAAGEPGLLPARELAGASLLPDAAQAGAPERDGVSAPP